MKNLSSILVKSELGIVEARQVGRHLARELGFCQVDQARLTTVISELARNIYEYAGVGEILLHKIEMRRKKGLKIVAKDEGPGIKDIGQAVNDSLVTSEGFGTGLTGVQRLMDEFRIESNEGQGTEVVTIKWLN